jgi:putative transcriptional regulator
MGIFTQQIFGMDSKKLGKKIKLARIEHDMTQGDLAEAIGALQKSISRYETGTSLPSLETLEKIAKTLKKPFGYFLDEQ